MCWCNSNKAKSSVDRSQYNMMWSRSVRPVQANNPSRWVERRNRAQQIQVQTQIQTQTTTDETPVSEETEKVVITL